MANINNPEQDIHASISNCDAYVVNNHQADRLFAAYPQRFIKLARSERFENYQFVSHPNIDKNTLTAIQEWLMEHQVLLSPIFKHSSTLGELSPAKDSDRAKHFLDKLNEYW